MSTLAGHVARATAIMCDLDGTLVDTMHLHFQAYVKVFQAYGFHLTEEQFFAAVGGPATATIPKLIELMGADGTQLASPKEIHRRKKIEFRTQLRAQGARHLPALDMLKSLGGRKRLGLVTSGNRDGVREILKAIQFTGRFETVICGDDVSCGKPDPEPYRIAAAMMNVDPTECLVLEDTADGIRSGEDAGMRVIDVRSVSAQEWAFVL